MLKSFMSVAYLSHAERNPANSNRKNKSQLYDLSLARAFQLKWYYFFFIVDEMNIQKQKQQIYVQKTIACKRKCSFQLDFILKLSGNINHRPEANIFAIKIKAKNKNRKIKRNQRKIFRITREKKKEGESWRRFCQRSLLQLSHQFFFYLMRMQLSDVALFLLILLFCFFYDIVFYYRNQRTTIRTNGTKQWRKGKLLF